VSDRRAPLRLGTRASPLALAQAALVAAAIDAEVELVSVSTSGDEPDGPAEDKRRWVDRIEDALAGGTIDLAVHSAKDVPGMLAPGLMLLGAPARADPRDALCGAASLAALRPGARIGTNSLRRAAQLRALRDDIEIVPIGGNIDTRLARLRDGALDAVVLAVAALGRLARAGGVPLDELVPAVGQGTLAIEGRANDQRVARAIERLRDHDTERALAAERALASALGADCHTPIGAHASVQADGALELRAFVGRIDGSQWLRDSYRGHDPVTLGKTVAERLANVGAGEML
jgi:hydroxymethylbilane synthase